MKKLLLTFVLLASSMLASEVDLKSPASTLKSYYEAINEGDLRALKQVMTPHSYDTDIQIYALSIAFKDKLFHEQLKQYHNNPQARKTVEKAVKKKLQARQKKYIKIIKELQVGKNRVIVKFTEDSKNKQLYFSKNQNYWRVDYLAGRTK